MNNNYPYPLGTNHLLAEIDMQTNVYKAGDECKTPNLENLSATEERLTLLGGNQEIWE